MNLHEPLLTYRQSYCQVVFWNNTKNVVSSAWQRSEGLFPNVKQCAHFHSVQKRKFYTALHSTREKMLSFGRFANIYIYNGWDTPRNSVPIPVPSFNWPKATNICGDHSFTTRIVPTHWNRTWAERTLSSTQAAQWHGVYIGYLSPDHMISEIRVLFIRSLGSPLIVPLPDRGIEFLVSICNGTFC